MSIDYQRKYIESVKIYHQLHAELSSLTMRFATKVHNLRIPDSIKSKLNEIAFDGADRIQEVDLNFRKLVRAKWTPPEEEIKLELEDILL